MKKLLLFVIALGILGAAIGCTGEPTESDKKAAADNFEQRNSTAKEGEIGR
ncbi:MAG: hypothetical protein JNM28_07485 [Armatimonadetes bacterium]|nr:hypothetical protein [Armatimonadota bacterium]MBS1711851.1 hypothetical protein [Armatimonadota bacterium]MBX3109595.1 hypothetical protein [Fimbriimonadaceae bacterium]